MLFVTNMQTPTNQDTCMRYLNQYQDVGHVHLRWRRVIILQSMRSLDTSNPEIDFLEANEIDIKVSKVLKDMFKQTVSMILMKHFPTRISSGTLLKVGILIGEGVPRHYSEALGRL